METIFQILSKYNTRVNFLDLELIIADVIKKPREFVLTYPKYQLTKKQELKTKNLLARRIRNEPLAYILGYKEFFGLDFKVNKHTLIPRPETELLVDETLHELKTKSYRLKTSVVDIGTGSGNIIISIANAMKNFKFEISNLKLFATDISSEALKIAKHNARSHKVDKKIKFIKGNLLEPISKNKKYIMPNTKCILLANLPYLSKEIYNASPASVKKYEPRLALLSAKAGLSHYEKLFKQIKRLLLITDRCSLIIELSPEQKLALIKLIKKHFPSAKPIFKKDLSGKCRICKIDM